MPKNKDLNKAGKAKKDEFYTDYDVIQSELNYYEDKLVPCYPPTACGWQGARKRENEQKWASVRKHACPCYTNRDTIQYLYFLSNN